MSIIDSVRQLASPSAGRTVPLATDEFFDVCSSKRRRILLDAIARDDSRWPLIGVLGHGADTAWAMSDPVGRVAVKETDGAETAADLTDDQEKAAYVSLYQTHLPRLDALNIVDWDKDAGEIRSTGHTAAAKALLRDMIDAVALDFQVYDRSNGHERAVNPDDVFHVLSCERRRHAISLLSDAGPGGEVTTGWLADNIAEIEFGERYTSRQRKRVYVGLYQEHLAKLDALNVVDYDGGGSVVATPRVPALRRVMILGEARTGVTTDAE